jgi:predicted CXXCH cytochrome family protein
MAHRCICKWRRRAAAATLIFSAAIAVLGCASSPRERYRVLSVFFDGVPNPDAPKRSAASVSTGRQTFVHKPYQDNLCNSCHLNTSDIFARAQVREDVCLDCHQNVPTQYAVMHGPVVNNECRQCHSPHSSAIPHLLKQPAPAVCTQCHEPGVVTLLHRQPLDPLASCIDCHSGHGGPNHQLLLAFKPTTRPAAPPAAPSAAPSAAPVLKGATR